MEKMSVTQLAEKMGIKRATLLDKIKRGTLPDGVQCKKVGKTYIILVPKGVKIEKSKRAEYIRNKQEQ